MTALIVAFALLMQNLDGTVVATALPAMARSFGADPLHMNLALTSYLLSLAVFIPVSGWMADRFGSRTVFRAAIGVFTVGSILCGQSMNLPMLVVSRIVQGLGGAMMVPVGRLLLLRSVAKSELVAAMAWLTTPALIGPVIGPPLGGFLVTYANWRWIFLINVPIGLIGIVLVTRYVSRAARGRAGPAGLGRADLLGGRARRRSPSGMELAGRGAAPNWVVGAASCSALRAAVAYLRARQAPARPAAGSVAAEGADLRGFGGGRVAVPGRRGGDPVPAADDDAARLRQERGAERADHLRQRGRRHRDEAGGAIGAALVRVPRDAVLERDPRPRSGSAICAAFRAWWPLPALYAVLISAGFLRSLQFTAYNTIAYADIPRARMSAATSLYSTIQQLSLTFGISLGAASLMLAGMLFGNGGGHGGRFLARLPGGGRGDADRGAGLAA